MRTIWARSAYNEVRELLRSERPDVVHFHNTFPLISPAAYYAARAEKVSGHRLPFPVEREGLDAKAALKKAAREVGMKRAEAYRLVVAQKNRRSK